AAPRMLGFDGFFKGAYSYHFHNFWWVPFDPVRNFPDLGPKFKEGEIKARMKLKVDARAEAARLAKAAAAGQKAGADADEVRKKQAAMRASKAPKVSLEPTAQDLWEFEREDQDLSTDNRDLAWSAVLKRTFEAYIRGERPNMYGEWLKW
ncbi:hypothetical protein FRC01_006075, partial [Tulasnella sp. 417]